MDTEQTAAPDTTQAAAQSTPAPEASPAPAAEAKPEPTMVSGEEKAAEAKPAEGAKTEETKAAKPEEAKKEETLDLKLPEGSKLDASIVEKVTAFAKEKGLTSEQAQTIIDEKHSAVEEYDAQQKQVLATANDVTWKDELMKDPDIGGTKFEEAGILAAKAADQWFGEGFAEQLKTMKLNHNPTLFRGLVKLAKAGANDTAVIPGNNPGRGKEPVEKLMYPNMFKEKGA